jgi:molybdate transport repressor ModE-like protein
MDLVPSTAWLLRSDPESGRPPHPIDARVLALVRAVARAGTLAGAARACGIPYRTAWTLIDTAERELATPLLELARGRGAALTRIAVEWIGRDDEARAALERADVRLALAREAGPATAFRVAASHDLALAQLRERWRHGHAVALDFHGSAESLDAFRAGNVDAAGFHVVPEATPANDPLLARIDPARDALLRFLTRVQGLMVRKGNPRNLRALADLARRRVRLVNRQPGSGTRLLLDRLLVQAGVDRAAIDGYGDEEFTHAAVAATVAAGRADVGFGIGAAAAQFRLDFVPVTTERYLFVCRRSALESTRVRAFRALLAGAATRAVVTPLPGYALDSPGRVLALSAR